MINIKNITKDYGQSRGVFDLSFQVNKGEVVGFLGPNGAGKTTTIRQLMGFSQPDSGEIYIDGMSCFQERHKIVKELGYLPGEIAFMDSMTGIEFIRFVASMKGMKNLGRAEELMERFELKCDGKLKKMSKGMKQKIAIVCAFMDDPEILILDEPTSGLDPLMQNVFVEFIKEEKIRNKTILMSSHMFEEIERTCDRVVIIKEGKLVAIENLEVLRENQKKMLHIAFKTEVMAQQFCQEFKQAVQESCKISMVIDQDLNQIIASLSKYEVEDIQTKNQSLEECFMHFYGGNEDD